MRKPAYIFDGRLILNREQLKAIGFQVQAIGKHWKVVNDLFISIVDELINNPNFPSYHPSL